MTTVESDGWIILRRRVSLAGRVLDAGGLAASGGELSATVSLPAAAAQQRPARRGTERPHAVAPASANDFARRHDARIRSDGYYFFLDLPVGDYVIEGRAHDHAVEASSVSIAPLVGAVNRPLPGTNLVIRRG